jgi:hypothetical protein
MKKIIAVACVILVLQLNANSQVDTRPFIFSVVPQVTMPISKFKESNKTGFGGNFIGQWSIAEKLKFLATFGGTLYRGKTYEIDPGYTTDYPAVSVLYLRGGLKYFVSEAIFVAGNLGVAKVHQPETKFGLTYAPQVGCELGGVDLFLKYDVVQAKTFNGSNVQAIGFCLGYRF